MAERRWRRASTRRTTSWSKAGCSSAVGVSRRRPARRRLWPVLLPAAVLALSLGGLPLTGGALAKLAVKAPLGDGVVGLLATLSAAGTTLLMLHFLGRLVAGRRAGCTRGRRRPGLPCPGWRRRWPSVAVPWALYLRPAAAPSAEALAPATLWTAVWPVLLGGVLAVGLRRWGDRLPRCPGGRRGGAGRRRERRRAGHGRRNGAVGLAVAAMAGGRRVAAGGGARSGRGDAGRALMPNL